MTDKQPVRMPERLLPELPRVPEWEKIARETGTSYEEVAEMARIIGTAPSHPHHGGEGDFAEPCDALDEALRKYYFPQGEAR